MGNFGLALVIVLGGWWLLRTLASSQPAKVRVLVRKIMGWALVAAGGFLMLRGSMNIALPLFVLGGGMIGESALFPDGLQWPGTKPGGAPGASPPVPRAAMTREEALAVLGLKSGASVEEVRLAHRRLMKDYHPDKGGTDYLATKINQAKDLLVSGT